jgi:hypothetical protein
LGFLGTIRIMLTFEITRRLTRKHRREEQEGTYSLQAPRYFPATLLFLESAPAQPR